MNKKSIHAGSIFVLIFLVLFLFNKTIGAQTTINRDISDNETWTPEGSPYIITKTIFVKAVLTITTENLVGGHNDVMVNIEDGANLIIGSSDTYGALNAQGTAQNSIYFTKRDSSSNWGCIRFWQRTRRSRTMLKHCFLSYGGSYVDGILVFDRCGEILIQDCTIDNSISNGTYVEQANPYIRDCTVQDSGTNGFYVYRGSPTIDNCTVQENAETGIRVEGQNGSTAAELSNSTITNNQAYGIRIATNLDCDIKISNNEISYNSTGGVFVDHKGSYINPELIGNTFIKNGPFPLRIPAYVDLSSDNSFVDDNATQGIQIIGADISTFVPCGTTVSWHNFGIPYIVKDGDVCVHGTQTIVYELEVAPGTEIRFDQGLGLKIGGGYEFSDNAKGILTAVGTKESPIIFTTSEPGQYWKGIQLTNHTAASQSRLDYCTVEFGGNKEDCTGYRCVANIYFQWCRPQADTIQNSTIRYSRKDGITVCFPHGEGHLNNCNIYGNSEYDIIVYNNVNQIYAERNYWGTPNGPSQDLCSSAVVGESITYEAWLEEEFTEPFRFTAAGADPTQFNPLSQITTINFTLSDPADWTLSILNRQFEKVWSLSGRNSSGEIISWNGLGNYGVVSGPCFYRIEAQNGLGAAAPAVGRLNLGNETIARISAPGSHSLFTTGTQIEIAGTAQTGPGGFYDVSYGAGENPDSWTLVDGPIYSPKENELLASWDTTGMNQPTYTIKLDVHHSDIIYSDLTTVDFYVEDSVPENASATICGYDNLGRLNSLTYPNGASILYTYDRAGNRMSVTREGEGPPTLIELLYFKATPTLSGVVLEWQTAAEIDSVGFNLYRKMIRESDYIKITPSLIPAEGGPTAGSRYSFVDVPPKRMSKWHYLLEEVENTGRTHHYGPISSRNITLKSYNNMGPFKKTFRVKCD